jgi:hypothetical protein
MQKDPDKVFAAPHPMPLRTLLFTCYARDTIYRWKTIIDPATNAKIS